MIASFPQQFEPADLADSLHANLDRVRRRAAAAWRVEDAPPIDEWIESSIVIPPESEGMPGRISFEQRPWWRDVLRWATDPETRDLAMVAATQVGKTLTMDVAMLLYFAEWFPAPAMVVLPDENEASMFRDRVYAVAKESRRVARFRRVSVPPQWKWNMKYIDLGAMRCYLAWSGSRQRTRGKPCWRVWCSEIDAYGARDKNTGDAVEAARQRVKSRPRFLRVYESSPNESPSRISDIESASGARYRWHGKCPHCGRLQEVRFFPHRTGDHAGRGGVVGYKDEVTGEVVSQDAARKAAKYGCLSGCEIEQHSKDDFLEAGRWVPLGCEVAADGTVAGDMPESTREIGAQLWSVHSPSINFGDLAAEYVKAQNEGTVAEFFGNWLSIPYTQRSKVPAYQELAAKLAWTHDRRTVPNQAWFLTAGVDVQGENNGVRYVIRGWAPERTSWLIDWGWIERIPGDENDLVKSDMRQMGAAVLDQAFPISGEASVNPLGRHELKTRLLCCDSNHLPFKVHHWIRSLPESWRDKERGRVRAIRGDHTVKPEMKFRHSLVESNTRTGERYEGGLDQWGVAVYPFYDQMVEMLSSEPGKPGAFYLTADVARDGRSYLEQLTNFHRKTEFDSKTGKKKTFWKPKTDRIPVDFWDCEIYALAAANMVVGDMGWATSAWESWRHSVLNQQSEKQQQQQQAPRIARRGGVDLGER